MLLAAGPPAYLVIPVVHFFVHRDGQPMDFLRKSFTCLALETNTSVSDTKELNGDKPKSAILHSGGPDSPPIPGQPG